MGEVCHRCILCGSDELSWDSVLLSQELIQRWLQKFNISIELELRGLRQIDKYHCKGCGFQFYDPRLAGSKTLYAQLQNQPSYYMSNKWEHQKSMGFLRPQDSVLEVGSGEGAFLQRLRTAGISRCFGLELNSEAVRRARRNGVDVRNELLQEHSVDHQACYDVVAHFQVLEHVPDPGNFLKSCVAILKPGGRLLIGVPNNAGPLRYATDDLLNMPPHHIGLFTPDVFRSQADCFGLKMEKILYEPLADYHIGWYGNAQINRLVKRWRIHWRSVKRLRANLPILIRKTRLQRVLKGHSMLIVLQKM